MIVNDEIASAFGVKAAKLSFDCSIFCNFPQVIIQSPLFSKCYLLFIMNFIGQLEELLWIIGFIQCFVLDFYFQGQNV